MKQVDHSNRASHIISTLLSVLVASATFRNTYSKLSFVLQFFRFLPLKSLRVSRPYPGSINLANTSAHVRWFITTRWLGLPANKGHQK